MTPADGGNNDILVKHWELSGLRVCDKGKMEAEPINISLGMKRWALNTPLSAPLGKRANISIKSQSHHSINTNPEAMPDVHRNTTFYDLNFTNKINPYG